MKIFNNIIDIKNIIGMEYIQDNRRSNYILKIKHCPKIIYDMIIDTIADKCYMYNELRPDIMDNKYTATFMLRLTNDQKSSLDSDLNQYRQDNMFEYQLFVDQPQDNRPENIKIFPFKSNK